MSFHNCIFLCVFHKPGYLTLLHILLQSIEKYGQLTEDTCILIYTSSAFKTLIEEKTYHLPIHYAVIDNYETVEQACRARLDVFQLPLVQSCQQILYLDTDIVVMKDLGPMFALCRENQLYALEEGSMKTHDPFWDYYGKTLFAADEMRLYENRTAFSSGILLFPNSSTIQQLFHTIALDCVHRPICQFDQPYIVHHAMKGNLIDNQSMIPYAILHNDYVKTKVIPSTIILMHFAGGVGQYQHKSIDMIQFLSEIDSQDIWSGCVIL